MMKYNKLVRDKIPEIIRNDNKECITEILDEKRYVEELKKKLLEEIDEYQTACTDNESLEELADILEIIHELAIVHGSSIEKVEDIRKKKVEKRGGFKDRIFLVGVKD